MGKILFLGIPAYGHVNPTLGIISELVKRGQEVTYFCTEEFRERIEKTGAIFKDYGSAMDPSNRKHHFSASNMTKETLIAIIEKSLDICEKAIESVLDKTNGTKFDYIGYAAACPFGSLLAQILKLPSFSSFAIFATPDEIMPKSLEGITEESMKDTPIMEKYMKLKYGLKEKYDIELPEIKKLFFNKGDVNFAYTSKYFIPNIQYYDDSFKFIGPPIYDRKEDLSNFPYEEIKDKKVIYISLGTVYSNFDIKLYETFFNAFKNEDVVVVMTAYKVDLSQFDIPKNFVVRNYISQTEILKYANAAVTHSGMNSTNDLLFNSVPFVAIPLGADQPYMASRTADLGACIKLDIDTLTPELLRNSVYEVMTNQNYMENIRKINNSFRESGGYKRAAEEVLKLKARTEILN
ncbi:MGT family glycosyltransferase [Clostridium acetobutylicum]|uniref:Glycosyl transferase n=1 Tax=Clostridium acetobutylicum (strain ATCC 824 / DSM 792 / JCM 1419 / IAM 19013 / LMG 5710 / NBRC 13948 / NRRL B-527 / VKM B-1787 / 2291 / W) TaxID=272562 RepID=Q97TQ3_CLOAB|nr:MULTISPECIES: glycosyltransferase [Clostridium]AAK76791.1 Glycosyl transferase [Clostridium acetobutylicum ATCC 824]ADZ22827.1 Glycosyl transferase [Clostridium acetobutylicum EA 2018]AEI34787.1 glycosyl transferase [Clostridium acetobutylicum DSM 1731]AWV82336.1 glycosyl transferase [Clostridium acetobutylicum]MBC2396000.1 glycosyl transferase [Clostridium acetobutylicum]